MEVRVPFLCVPIDGETVSSVPSRTLRVAGISPKQLLLRLTGQRFVKPLLGPVPNFLGKIARNAPSGHPWCDAEYILRKNTNLQYLTYFYGPEQRSEARKCYLQGQSPLATMAQVGLSHFHCKVGGQQLWCVHCAMQDESELGFSYFHREHQLPGVVVCWKHSCILSCGCRRCGPYPLRGHGLTMPGHCMCVNGVDPLPVPCDVPAKQQALNWVARESAYMLESKFGGFDSARAVLLGQFSSSGFCRGTQPLYSKIAEAVDSKYGKQFLEWLKYPAFADGNVSPWIRGALRGSRASTRSPAIGLLLLAGTVCDSLSVLEKTSLKCCIVLKPVQACPSSTARKPFEWASSLAARLEENSFRIVPTAAQLGTNSYSVAAEALRQGIRIPLTERVRNRAPDSTVNSVKQDIREGIQKQKIQEKHSISEWTLLLIELDQPGISEEHRRAASIRVRSMHRAVLDGLIVANPALSRQNVLAQAPGTYYYMLAHDSEWFDARCPVKLPSFGHIIPRHRRNRQVEDTELAEKICRRAQEVVKTPGRPVRLTETGLLKCFSALSKFTTNRGFYPRTAEALAAICETGIQYTRRKIVWAVGVIGESGKAVSMNLLRRVASTSPCKLHALRNYVAETAIDHGVDIDARSVFASVNAKNASDNAV